MRALEAPFMFEQLAVCIDTPRLMVIYPFILLLMVGLQHRANLYSNPRWPWIIGSPRGAAIIIFFFFWVSAFLVSTISDSGSWSLNHDFILFLASAVLMNLSQSNDGFFSLPFIISTTSPFLSS